MLSIIKLIGKPGTGIFLMKESSKLYRPHKEREQRKLIKRLGGPAAAVQMQRMLEERKARDRTSEADSSQRCLRRSKAMYR